MVIRFINEAEVWTLIVKTYTVHTKYVKIEFAFNNRCVILSVELIKQTISELLTCLFVGV